jgi:hypothetical protein
MDNKAKENPLTAFNLGDLKNDQIFPDQLQQQQQQQQAPAYDPLLFAHNPGSYEDLNKKTKGKFLNNKISNLIDFFF